MPISAISAARRSRGLVRPGAAVARCSTISARARCCSPTRPRSRIRSSCWCPNGRCCPWSCWRPAATVIASQAVITGAYSLVHAGDPARLVAAASRSCTSASQAGRIYIPRVNRVLLVGVLLLVGVFSTRRARSPPPTASPWPPPWWSTGCWLHRGLEAVALAAVAGRSLVAPLVLVDVTFFSANLLKLLEGAWAPLLFGARSWLLMLTGGAAPPASWRRRPGAARCRSIPFWPASRRSRPTSCRARRCSHQPAGLRAHRAPAQSQAQQGAARAQRDPHHRHHRHAEVA